MAEASILDVKAFFGMSASEFRVAWQELTDAEKEYFKAAVTEALIANGATE